MTVCIIFPKSGNTQEDNEFGLVLEDNGGEEEGTGGDEEGMWAKQKEKENECWNALRAFLPFAALCQPQPGTQKHYVEGQRSLRDLPCLIFPEQQSTFTMSHKFFPTSIIFNS